jgi:Na+-transporting NADH:ubiquinone oxidoreductase subunit E
MTLKAGSINDLFVRFVFREYDIRLFPGMCSYLAVQNRKTHPVGMAVIFVLLITLPVNYLMDRYVLSPAALARSQPGMGWVDIVFLS